MYTMTTLLSLLLPLIQIASCIPMNLHTNAQFDIWVRDVNTLNATCWPPAAEAANLTEISSSSTSLRSTGLSIRAAQNNISLVDSSSAAVETGTGTPLPNGIPSTVTSDDPTSPFDPTNTSISASLTSETRTVVASGLESSSTASLDSVTIVSTTTSPASSATSFPIPFGNLTGPFANTTSESSAPQTTGPIPSPTGLLTNNTAHSNGNGNQIYQPGAVPYIGGSFRNITRLDPNWTNSTADTPLQNVTVVSPPSVTEAPASGGRLNIQIVNKLPSRNVKVYMSGLDPSGALVMLGSGGQWVYPSTLSTTPIKINLPVEISLGAPNSTTTLTTPGYISSSRIWIGDGGLTFYVVSTGSGPGLVEPAIANSNDPNSQVNYGFAELTWEQKAGLYADITAVDFVGLPLGMELEDTSNNKVSVLGTPSDAAPRLCNMLKQRARNDGRPWGQLCAYSTNGDLVRVLAPNNAQSQNPTLFSTYFAQYVDRVWQKYTTQDLIINTQTAPGNVSCRVNNSVLNCAGDNRSYAKPTSTDIFGCNSGPFAIQASDNAVHVAVVPRLCAAFNRATLLLEGGHVQPSLPPSKYYTNPAAGPRNWYSKFVHDLEGEGGKGYAFSYDDVAPSVELDQSGLVASVSPKVLRVIVGGT